MTLADRIKAARIASGLKKSAFAAAVGVSPGAVTQWEDGTIKTLKGPILVKMASVAKVNPAWLDTGRGLMQPLEHVSEAEAELLAIFRKLADHNRQSLLGIARTLLANQPDTPPSPVDPFKTPVR